MADSMKMDFQEVGWWHWLD